MNSLRSLTVHLIFLIANLSLWGWATALSQTMYTVTDLGGFSGGYSSAYGINATGQVVGWGLLPGAAHAFLWEDGVMADLGTLGGINSFATGINTSNQVVGSSLLAGDANYHAFLWEGGVMTDLGTLGGNLSDALGINTSGQVVGWAQLPGNQGYHALIWESGVMTDLGTLGGSSIAYGINTSGQVVGTSFLPGNTTSHAFLWENGVMTDLGTLGGTTCTAYGINSLSQVIGGSHLQGNTTYHGFIWENDVMTDLGTLGGTSSTAYAINDSSQVVGESTIQDGTRHAFLWENGVMTDLNSLIDPGSNWILYDARGINDTAIVGTGLHDGVTRGFLLTPLSMPPAITITSPAADDLWVAGEQNTIRWTSTGIDSVGISFSINFEDGGGQFESIVERYPAGQGEYVWDVPDTILSRKCAISIEDASNPSSFVVSEVFKIKGYVLTRVDTDGQYEPFHIGEDSWIFANESANIWPTSWYQQFDYQNGNDPFTNERYASDFRSLLISAEPEDFPDWPSFVRTFGVEQCYFSVDLNIPNQFVVTLWALINGNWGGSCAGFSASSFLAFDHKSDFISRFGVPNFNELIELMASDDTRRVINELWTYQSGSAQRASNSLRDFTRPAETLFFTKNMFLSEDENNMEIYMYDENPTYAHAVNPWKIDEDASLPGIWYIYVYDNNFPYLTTQKVTVNTDANSWNYGDVGGSTGLIQSLPSSSYLQNALLPFSGGTQTTLSGTETISVFNASSSSIVFTNQSGDSAAYSNADSSYISSIAEALPELPLTGYPHPPIGYLLPEDEYAIRMFNFQDPLTYFSVLDTGLVQYYARTDAASTQTDLLGFDTGIGVRNPDPDSKVCNFGTIIIEETSQKQADILNCSMGQNDSLHFWTINSDDVELVNVGSQKTYDLNLGLASATGRPRFEHLAIALAGSSTHLIAPDWTDLLVVPIYIDLGNNGTIDDTMFVVNTVDVDEQEHSGIPTEYNLAQNYPNPFNPSTTISYQIPLQSQVTLKVYDLLGREVATLVNEDLKPGSYDVTFDATGLASGVYVYQLTAGSFTDVKKLLVLR